MSSATDNYLFREGTHDRLYDQLGCHLTPQGAHFAVWAPEAESVSVIGDWNAWSDQPDPLALRPDGTGIWSGSVAAVQHGQAYKYRIRSRQHGHVVDKADPFAMEHSAVAIANS